MQALKANYVPVPIDTPRGATVGWGADRWIALHPLALRWVVGNRRAYPTLLAGRGFLEN